MQLETTSKLRNLPKLGGCWKGWGMITCWSIADCHTYMNIHDMDYQSLMVTDFLVNAFGDNISVNTFKAYILKS